MKSASTSRNFIQLTAVFAIILISVSVMGAGCGSAKDAKMDTDTNASDSSGNGAMVDNHTEADTDTDVAVEVQTTTTTLPTTATGSFMGNKNPVLPNPSSTNTGTLAAHYKDGVYTALGQYNSPAGAEEIDVTLTLKKDIVTDANVVEKAVNPRSVYMQGQFTSGYKAYVIGQNIATLKLTKVSGSSLTPNGFNDAVAKIRTQAAIQ